MGFKSKTIRNQSGQLTIFLAITLVIIMGLLAFIINIGLFVKAKINLQNATDAAAFAGAATQARQLTNISYVNWEMRNTYKEWMFKYYILGQLHFTLPPNGVHSRSGSMHDSKLTGNGPVDFYLWSFENNDQKEFDRYNVPSICIHNNISTNICPIYKLPGVPRFESLNIAGISDIHERFVNKLVEEKAANCTTRTQMNFLAASAWAYSTGVDIVGAPLIAGGRIGAWVQSLELALRMRNLEMIVNRPPITKGINFQNIQELETTGATLGYNERPLKAFYSAYRNLGGGKYKDADQSQDELSGSFKLYEIAPNPYVAPEKSASTFLIPRGITYPSESTEVSTKHYLDLKAYSLNFAPLYTSFISMGGEFSPTDPTATEAACGVSKSAIPVPGYIMGFEKNPEVLTYYAVKGEAKFIGLFYPFTKQEGITLTTYSAAKPFGGRIGPKLFSFTNGDRAIRPRIDQLNYPSAPFITAFNFTASELTGGFNTGDLIPQSKSFWSDSFSSNVGGIPGSGETVNFVVPNMVYGANTINDLEIQTGENKGLQVIQPASSASVVAGEKLGLHERQQINLLKKALGPTAGANVTTQQLDRALATVRQPTMYDALNYLIPDLTQRPDANAPAVVVPISSDGNIVRYRLFAPLLGENLLYRGVSDVEGIVLEYLNANRPSVESYMKGLHEVAKSVANKTSATDPSLGKKAARSIHAGFESGSHIPPVLDCTYLDVASRYWHFFTESSIKCNVEPLPKAIVEYLNKFNTSSNLYYETSYVENQILGDKIYTAYFPGKNYGSDTNAIVDHPLKLSTATNAYSAKRNFYSTKFVELSKVIRTGPSTYDSNPPLREDPTFISPDLRSSTIKNLILESDGPNLELIKH